MNSRYTIDCKALPEAGGGLSPGREMGVEWTVGDDFWAGRENCDVTGSDVTVEVRKSGGSAIAGEVELEVDIKGVATMPCDRCLDDCTLPVEWRETTVMECAGGKIDLEQYIYESIILGLPFSKVHAKREECNPEMLKRLNS